MKVLAEYKNNNVEANLYYLDDGTYLATSRITIEIQGVENTWHQSSTFDPNPEKMSNPDTRSRYFKANLMAIALKHLHAALDKNRDAFHEAINMVSDDFVRQNDARDET